MTYSMQPFACDPRAVKGLSESLILGHYENNYGDALARDFGSPERWRAELVAMGKALSGGVPILALDMYEHAYHLDDGAKAAAHVEAFTQAIDRPRAPRLRRLPAMSEACPGHQAPQNALTRRGGTAMSLKTRIAALAIIAALASPAAAAEREWSDVGKALGKDGQVQPGGIYRVALPRTDLKVTLDGVALKPGFALGSWLAFAPEGDQAMVMGDLVMTQDEINPVMKKLEDSGIEVTALHNHLLRAEPATMYMHVLGHGDPVKLAQELHAALALSKTPFEAPSGASEPPRMDLDTAAIDQIMGAKGKANGGVLSYGIPRAEKIAENGMAVPPPMGSAVGINFQPTGGGKAAITGDFVLTAKEVNPVAKALRDNGIEVTALHNHMLDEQPRLFFMHFWANDDAQKLAKGLRAALDKMNVAHS